MTPCTCCGDTTYETDPASGLCIVCQPCPHCGETGGDCNPHVDGPEGCTNRTRTP